jgi:hypothetical protein
MTHHREAEPREILGAVAWRLLHRLAVTTPSPAFHRRLLAHVCALYPCPDCREHFNRLPCVSGAQACSAAMRDPVSWWFDAHNAVSQKVHPGRPPAPRAVLKQYAADDTAAAAADDDDDALLRAFVWTLRAVYVQAGGDPEDVYGAADDRQGARRRSAATPRQLPREMAHSIAHYRRRRRQQG